MYTGRLFLDMVPYSMVGASVDVTPYLASRTSHPVKSQREKLMELVQRILFVVVTIKITILFYCYNCIIIYDIIQNTGMLCEYHVS
jgi:hypothetical protein